eukprot:4427307-Pyramimonas_sp.AAC.1
MLGDARIGGAKLPRYRRAAQQFVDYLNATNLQLPVTWEDMDTTLQDYFEYLEAEGATKGQAIDALSGIQHVLRTR